MAPPDAPSETRHNRFWLFAPFVLLLLVAAACTGSGHVGVPGLAMRVDPLPELGAVLGVVMMVYV